MLVTSTTSRSRNLDLWSRTFVSSQVSAVSRGCFLLDMLSYLRLVHPLHIIQIPLSKMIGPCSVNGQVSTEPKKNLKPCISISLCANTVVDNTSVDFKSDPFNTIAVIVFSQFQWCFPPQTLVTMPLLNGDRSFVQDASLFNKSVCHVRNWFASQLFQSYHHFVSRHVGNFQGRDPQK